MVPILRLDSVASVELVSYASIRAALPWLWMPYDQEASEIVSAELLFFP